MTHSPKWYDNKRGQNGNGSPWDLLRKYAGKQENHDILEEECDPPQEQFARRKRMEVGVEMQKFGAEQGEKSEGEEIPPGKLPKDIERLSR